MVERFEPSLLVETLAQWRDWLESHGDDKETFLIVFKKGTGVASVGWYEAIEHALCFGWVDSKAHRRDDQSVYLRFTPRNPKSSWGPRNRDRAERLIADGHMRPAGLALIELAKATGRWE